MTKQKNQFKGCVKDAIINQFTDKEVKSSYGYPCNYKPKDITEQIDILRQLFPKIGYADKKLAEQPLPPGAEGWFAILRWQSVAKTYGKAIEKVFDLIKQTRNGKFCNYRDGQLGPCYLYQSAKTAKALQTLADQQKNYNILVVPAQFGLRHRGRSVRRTYKVMDVSEFGLGVFEIGCMLLTHPERFQNFIDLRINCAGDEYTPNPTNDFLHTPYFSFYDNEIKFNTYWPIFTLVNYGSPSGFLPKQVKP